MSRSGSPRTAQQPNFSVEQTAERATPLADWSVASSEARFLVVQGAQERVAPNAHGYALREALGDRVCLAEIADAGHWVLLEQPEAAAQAALSFLRG